MLRLPQHIASNVVKGLDPKRGVGFQTLATSEELLDTEDLRVLEEMAPYYNASRADRQAGALPVRELYYRLPSGSYAVTRIEDWGADPHGRAGNSLAHSLVVPADAAESTRWDPLALLDHLVARRPAELPTPGVIAPFELVELPPAEPVEVSSRSSIWLAGLLSYLYRELASPMRPTLSIAPRDEMRALIRTLEWALPSQERAQLTFATHFYRDCHAHRDRFRLVTIDASSEAPIDEDAYRLTYWDRHGRTTPMGAFNLDLAGNLIDQKWTEARILRDRVDGIRQGRPVSLPDDLARPTINALAEATGARLVPELLGKPRLIATLFDTDYPNREIAEALLRAAGPTQVFGNTPDAMTVTEVLPRLEKAAGKQAWREWTQRWSDELPEGAAGGKRPWWAVWKH